jgi:hypothetical protein
MTIAENQRSGREVWGRVLVGVSVAGTVLTVVVVLLFGVFLYEFMADFGGSPAPWWYWPSVLGFAVAGVLGLGLSTRTPRLALVLRLVACVPLIAIGLTSPWLMAAVVLVGAAHVSLLLATWRSTQHTPGRLVAGAVAAVILALLIVPVDQDLSCENVGDPPETCDAWYSSAMGWGLYEEDDRHLRGWIVVAVLAGALVAIPVPPRD